MNVLFLTPPLQNYTLFGASVLPYTELAMYAAFLRQYVPDVEVDLLECPVHRITFDQLEEEIDRRSPDVVVSGVFSHAQAGEAMAAFTRIKETSPDIVTIAEGIHFGNIPVESLEDCSDLDFVITGEVEQTLVELVEAIARNDTDYGAIKGLAWRDDGSVVVNERRPLINNLDDLPRPAYDLMALESNPYRQFATFDHFIKMYASRGCKGRCEFCNQLPLWGGTYRTFSGQRVAEDVAHLYHTYGVRNVEFYDADFGEDVLMLENFCQTLLQQDVDVHMWGLTRADNVLNWHRAGLLPKLREVGLKLVCVGVEYHTDERLKGMGKKLTTAEVTKAFQVLRDNGIGTSGTVMLGWPDETAETAEELYRYVVDRIRPDILILLMLQPLPGTPMWRRLKKESELTRDYSQYDRCHPVMPSQTLSQEQLGKLYFSYMGRFYTDSTHVNSVLEGGNPVSAGIMRYFTNMITSRPAPPKQTNS